MMSEWKFTIKDLAEKPELLMPGHRACAGCGPAVAYRQILKAARGPIIATNATGCMEVNHLPLHSMEHPLDSHSVRKRSC
jgi:pyruvate/2-oxoacid:ferredoxin oxidoreductase beta subunit